MVFVKYAKSYNLFFDTPTNVISCSIQTPKNNIEGVIMWPHKMIVTDATFCSGIIQSLAVINTRRLSKNTCAATRYRPTIIIMADSSIHTGKITQCFPSLQ